MQSEQTKIYALAFTKLVEEPNLFKRLELIQEFIKEKQTFILNDLDGFIEAVDAAFEANPENPAEDEDLAMLDKAEAYKCLLNQLNSSLSKVLSINASPMRASLVKLRDKAIFMGLKNRRHLVERLNAKSLNERNYILTLYVAEYVGFLCSNSRCILTPPFCSKENELEIMHFLLESSEPLASLGEIDKETKSLIESLMKKIKKEFKPESVNDQTLQKLSNQFEKFKKQTVSNNENSPHKTLLSVYNSMWQKRHQLKKPKDVKKALINIEQSVTNLTKVTNLISKLTDITHILEVLCKLPKNVVSKEFAVKVRALLCSLSDQFIRRINTSGASLDDLMCVDIIKSMIADVDNEYELALNSHNAVSTATPEPAAPAVAAESAQTFALPQEPVKTESELKQSLVTQHQQVERSIRAEAENAFRVKMHQKQTAHDQAMANFKAQHINEETIRLQKSTQRNASEIELLRQQLADKKIALQAILELNAHQNAKELAAASENATNEQDEAGKAFRAEFEQQFASEEVDYQQASQLLMAEHQLAQQALAAEYKQKSETQNGQYQHDLKAQAAANVQALETQSAEYQRGLETQVAENQRALQALKSEMQRAVEVEKLRNQQNADAIVCTDHDSNDLNLGIRFKSVQASLELESQLIAEALRARAETAKAELLQLQYRSPTHARDQIQPLRDHFLLEVKKLQTWVNSQCASLTDRKNGASLAELRELCEQRSDLIIKDIARNEEFFRKNGFL